MKKSVLSSRSLLLLIVALGISLVVAIYIHLSSRNNLTMQQSEKIARLEAVTECIKTKIDKNKCADLRVYKIDDVKPGMASKDGFHYRFFGFTTGDSQADFSWGVHLDLKGNILSPDELSD